MSSSSNLQFERSSRGSSEDTRTSFGSHRHTFMLVLKAAALYFAIVFGTGFVLGNLRVLLLLPRFGIRAAELMEMPFMFIAIVLAARLTVRCFRLHMSRPMSIVVGMLALCLVVLLEFTVVLWLRGTAYSDYLTERDPVSGTVYYLMLLIFGAMPWLMVSHSVEERAQAKSPTLNRFKRSMIVRKVLLFCGILSSLLYVATDILGAMRFEGYSYISQTVSELSAIGAQSRPLVVPLFITYSAIVIASGLGVWASANGKRALHIVGGLLIGYGAINLVAPFTPMHLRGAESTMTDTLHIIHTIVTVLFILLTIGFGATVFGKCFRLYSIGTILILAVFGALAGLDGPRIAANLPRPWVGVTERINVFGYLLWVMVLAVALLRIQMKRPMVAPAGDVISVR